MKKIILLLLITSLCFSQNKSYSIEQVDSICKVIKPSIACGTINNNKKKIVGGFSITTYKTDDKSKIIKGIYEENITSKKSYSYNYYSEFYYHNNQPTYLKIIIIRKNKSGNEETLQYNLGKEELEDYKEIKNIFLINIRKQINYMNSEILKSKKF